MWGRRWQAKALCELFRRVKCQTHTADGDTGILFKTLESSESAEWRPVLDEICEAVNGSWRVKSFGASAV